MGHTDSCNYWDGMFLWELCCHNQFAIQQVVKFVMFLQQKSILSISLKMERVYFTT